jgi:hypothetical protein
LEYQRRDFLSEERKRGRKESRRRDNIAKIHGETKR